MCGRFALITSVQQLQDEFELDEAVDFVSYNIAPSEEVPVIHLNSGHKRQLTLMQWGLLPSWVQDKQNAYRPINARLETLNSKRTFKNAFSYRCLIPISGFYEWKKEQKDKQPYYFCHVYHQLMAFAGLWSHWTSHDEELYTFTIITTAADQIVAPIHERMPLIIQPAHYYDWLSKGDIYTISSLMSYPVSKDVNHPRRNDPRLINPINSQTIVS